jgi:hypothetical protein
MLVWGGSRGDPAGGDVSRDDDDVYECAHCGGLFTKSRDGEPEAQAEAIALWGRPGDHPEMALICDDCYQQFMAWYKRRRERN